MTLVALTHGYIRTHAMGGEVSLHRTLVAAKQPTVVLTQTTTPYTVDGIHVDQINTPDVLDVSADPAPIAGQLRDLGASAVIAQNELSFPAVRAARLIGIPSIVSVHTPPKYGRSVRRAIQAATHVVYNTDTSQREWRRKGFVLHPPISPLPKRPVAPRGDAYTLLSSLLNKGVTVVLELAERMPEQRFIIVRSPAEATHGIANLEERAAVLPNVELHPRLAPDKVAKTYLSQTRILLAPSRYETYGMSAIEAAGYGIPSVHVDTPHVREGIGTAAQLTPPLDADAAHAAINTIENDYEAWSNRARERAEEIAARQESELYAWAEYIAGVMNARRHPRSRRTP